MPAAAVGTAQEVLVVRSAISPVRHDGEGPICRPGAIVRETDVHRADVSPKSREFAVARIIAVELVSRYRTSGKNGVSPRGRGRQVDVTAIEGDSYRMLEGPPQRGSRAARTAPHAETWGLWRLFHLQKHGARPHLPHQRTEVSHPGSQPNATRFWEEDRKSLHWLTPSTTYRRDFALWKFASSCHPCAPLTNTCRTLRWCLQALGGTMEVKSRGTTS
jgi:hypothetical protein